MSLKACTVEGKYLLMFYSDVTVYLHNYCDQTLGWRERSFYDGAVADTD